jgi:hypothetical protein
MHNYSFKIKKCAFFIHLDSGESPWERDVEGEYSK